MLKPYLFILFILSCFSCKKKVDLPQSFERIYKLHNIYTLTPSGATLYYDFIYTGATLTTLKVTNTNTGQQFFRHEFIYDRDKLVRVETYYTTPTTSTPERKLLLFYTGDMLTKIERHNVSNGNFFLSAFVTYMYNNGKMTKKICSNQQSWGEQIICRADYSYDAPGNITNAALEYPLAGTVTVRITPTYTNIENTLLVTNPPLKAIIWDLTNPNFFTNGFDEILLYSKNYVNGFKRDINGSIRDFNFTMDFDVNKMPGRIFNYPDLFTNSSDPVFHDMKIAYTLK